MSKSWDVFRRDLGRLFRVRKAWIILLGVLITPALYAWFNIGAFWDPYANTGNIEVAVANLDEGASSDLTGKVNVGAQVVDQLRDNDQLGWKLMSQDQAYTAVRSGDAYAAIVIPKDFSANLLSITSGSFTQPTLQYYVDEKASAVAPKITDVGASELDKKITGAFKERVATTATETLKDAGDDVTKRLFGLRDDTSNALGEANESLGSARQRIAAAEARADNARGTVTRVRTTLDEVDTVLADIQKATKQLQPIIGETQDQIVSFTDKATRAYSTATSMLATISADANTSITEISETLRTVGARADTAIGDLNRILDANQQAVAQLQTLLSDSSLDAATKQRLEQTLTNLQQRNTADQQVVAELSKLKTSTGDTVESFQKATQALGRALAQSRSGANDARSAVSDQLPDLNRAMSKLSASAGSLSAAIGSQRDVLSQAARLTTSVDAQLRTTAEALKSLEETIAGSQRAVGTAQTDIEALTSASQWGTLSTVSGLDPEQIAQFVASPIEVTEHVEFGISTYGSAMAALFTNLSLWIGAFVLMVILKIEVDTEGFDELTVRQAYGGRFMLFAVIATCQALIVSAGNLVIGVQTVMPLAFIATTVVIALAYLSIIYALCVAFGHIGRGLCILLVIMQIPGASGLYPIELMPSFFRTIYPLLPFSYGIDAMRETIGGFYGLHYWKYLGALSVFVVLAFLIGLVFRTRFAHFSVLFNRQVASTGLLNAENVQVTGTGYRLSDVFRAMSNQPEHRDDLVAKADRFTERYPAYLRAAVLVGAVGLVLLGLTAGLLPGASALLLGLWALWCLIIMVTLMVLAYVKHSYDEMTEAVSTGLADPIEGESAIAQEQQPTDEPLEAFEPETGASETETAPEPEPEPEPDPEPELGPGPDPDPAFDALFGPWLGAEAQQTSPEIPEASMPQSDEEPSDEENPTPRSPADEEEPS